jgi:hypothetical protein
VSWFDGGKVKMAQLSRDGLGPVSVLGKVTGEQPRPSLAAGKGKGDFWLAWQDFESGHTEAWLTKVACKL